MINRADGQHRVRQKALKLGQGSRRQTPLAMVVCNRLRRHAQESLHEQHIVAERQAIVSGQIREKGGALAGATDAIRPAI